MTKPTAKKASAMTSVRQQLQRILKRLEGRSEATPEESLQQILALPAKQVIPMLIEALEKSPHYLVRLVSAMALGELRAEKAVPVLISTLSDSSLTVKGRQRRHWRKSVALLFLHFLNSLTTKNLP
jgi:HEAT repeat protein